MCNTRKSRDKRVKRYTVGLLLGSSPCGVARLVEELYGCEAISQVYGIVTEHVAKLSEKRLEVLVYDDACHLAGFSKNHVRAHRNETTEFVDNLIHSIDFFHFKNHIDPFCHQNFNPRNVPQLEGVNTVVCEQLFKGINQYSNCKSMNEPHFFIYFFFNIDLHNLKKEGQAYMVNPKNEVRNQAVKKSKLRDVDFESLKKTATEADPEAEAVSPFNCPGCKCGFESESSLKKHIDSKHAEMNPENPRACTICDKILSTEQRLRTHMKTHLQCKFCKAEFKQEHQMILHKKEHTTCKGCGNDFKTLSKLTRHGKCPQ